MPAERQTHAGNAWPVVVMCSGGNAGTEDRGAPEGATDANDDRPGVPMQSDEVRCLQVERIGAADVLDVRHRHVRDGADRRPGDHPRRVQREAQRRAAGLGGSRRCGRMPLCGRAATAAAAGAEGAVAEASERGRLRVDVDVEQGAVRSHRKRGDVGGPAQLRRGRRPPGLAVAARELRNWLTRPEVMREVRPRQHQLCRVTCTLSHA